MRLLSPLLAMLLMLCCRNGLAADLIGSVIPPYPVDWKEVGGACVSRSLGLDRICDYSVGVLQSPSGLLLYVGKSAPKINAKRARWLVTDEMPHPSIPPNHQLVYSVCRLNGKKDDAILAVVRNQKVEWYKDIHTAYRVNLSSGRFEKIQPKGIECLNDSWGAE